MANKTLLDIHAKMAQSEALLTSTTGAQFLIQGIKDVMLPILEASDKKFSEWMETIPADFNMAKVPDELKDMVKNKTTELKQEYVELSKEASYLSPRNPRYQELVSKMNEIRTGFENIAAGVARYKQMKDEGVNNHGNLSSFNDGNDRVWWNSLVMGEGSEGATIGVDGFSIKDSSGNLINMMDVKAPHAKEVQLSGEFMQMSVDNLNSIKSKNSKFDKSFWTKKVSFMLDNAGATASSIFAFDGLEGDETGMSSFMASYLQDTLGLEPGSEAYNIALKDFRNPIAFQKYRKSFINHLVGTLEQEHTEKLKEFTDVNDSGYTPSATERTLQGFVGGVNNRNAIVSLGSGHPSWNLGTAPGIGDFYYNIGGEEGDEVTIMSPYQLQAEYGGRFASQKNPTILTNEQKEQIKESLTEQGIISDTSSDFSEENVTALGLGTATKASEGDIVAKFNSSKLFDGYSFTEEWEVDGAAMNMKLPGWTDNDARTKIILLNAPDAYEQIVEFMKNNPI